MTKILTVLAIASSLLLTPTGFGFDAAHANSCRAKGAKMAAQSNARFVSAKTVGNKCHIKLSKPQAGQAPRIVRRVVPK